MAQRVVNFRGGEQVVVPYRLSDITTSHNPRKPVRKLQRQGIVPLDFFRDFALSEDAAKNLEYITKMSEEPEIVSLARSIQRIGQAQPIVLRTFRVKVGKDSDTYEERAGVGAGERRVLACGLLEAVRKVAVAQGKVPGDLLRVGDQEFTVSERTKPWTVDAIRLSRITVEEAAEIGWDENAQRLEMNDMDWGEKFDTVLRTYNPLTQKPYSLQEVADKYGKHYHWVRGRAALPYLPTDLQAQVEDGLANITEACLLALKYKAKALADEQKREGVPALPDQGEEESAKALDTALPGRRERRATLGLTAVQSLFDATPDANGERRLALAEVMGLSLEQAAADSLARKTLAEIKKAKQERRKPAA